MIDITVCILNYNAGRMTKKCIDSIIQHSNNIQIEIIVVDNCSNDNSINAAIHEKYTLVVLHSFNL